MKNDQLDTGPEKSGVSSMRCNKDIHAEIDRRLGLVFDCGLAIAEMMREGIQVSTCGLSQQGGGQTVLVRQVDGQEEISYLRKCGNYISGMRVTYDSGERRMAFVERFDRKSVMARVELLFVDKPVTPDEFCHIKGEDVEIIGDSCRIAKRGILQRYFDLKPNWLKAHRSARITGRFLPVSENSDDAGRALVSFLDDITKRPEGIPDDLWPKLTVRNTQPDGHSLVI